MSESAAVETKPCEICGKPFARNRADGPRRWASRAFCSISCSRRQREPKSYRRGKGGERLHRLVMAEKLGRALRPGERVRFVNGDRKDVRPENLELWGDHARPAGPWRFHPMRAILPANLLRCGHKLAELNCHGHCRVCHPAPLKAKRKSHRGSEAKSSKGLASIHPKRLRRPIPIASPEGKPGVGRTPGPARAGGG